MQNITPRDKYVINIWPHILRQEPDNLLWQLQEIEVQAS